MRYSIFDPTGNITALVEDPADEAKQPAIAAEIMRRHPEVEQVGFLTADAQSGEVSLRMAGGEFCGNASMSAAALRSLAQAAPLPASLRLSVSGAQERVEVRLLRREEDRFFAAVRMPAVKSVREQDFAFADLRGSLTVVELEGITHIVVEDASPFFALCARIGEAELAVRQWCRSLGAAGLGLLFVSGDVLTPLVFVPGSDTVFWEASCASGTAAVGAALAAKSGAIADRQFCEPGGSLRVVANPADGTLWLYGAVRLLVRICD